jgi:hypothetical protein
MTEKKNEDISATAPVGPWDAPLRDYVKTHILMVTVYDFEDNIIKQERIDYGNFDHRKFLGKITFWATTNNYSVETMALKDWEVTVK